MADVATPVPTSELAELADRVIPPRDYAPTERQLAVGDVAPTLQLEALTRDPLSLIDPPDESPAQPLTGAGAPGWRQAHRAMGRGVRSYGQTFSLRGLDAPRLPLMVFCFAAMFGGWEGQALGLIGPELRTEFGLSLATLQSVASVSNFVGLAAAIPMGYLVDRVRRVWLFRIGQVFGQVSIFMQVFSSSQTGYVESRLVGSGAAIVGGPAGGPLTADYFAPAVRARVFTTIGAFSQLGGLIGLPVAGLLVTLWGWRAATLALSLPAVLAVGGSFLLKEPKRGMVDRLAAGVAEDRAEIEAPRLSLVTSMRASWNIRTVRRLAFAGIPTGVGLTSMALVIQQYQANKFQLSPLQRSYIAELTALLVMPAMLFSGRVADRLLAWKPQRVLVYQGLLLFMQAFNLVIIAFIPNLQLNIALTILNSFVSAVLGPASFTLNSLLVPAQYRGVGMQVYAPFALVGIILGPVITSLTARADISTTILCFAPLFVIGAVMSISAAGTVERDMRAARAANLADAEATRAKAAGESKMLICRDLDVEYNGVRVLFNVDFDVTEGETVALLGTNGAGKSTLLRAIAGIHQAANGAVYFDGLEITHAPAHENALRGIVMMPGGRAVFPSLTVDQNLQTATWTYRDDTELVKAKIDQVLEFFPRLRERLEQPAGKLSGGEQQMVALGQAFLMKPRMLMIDELSLGLAPAVVEQLLGILREIRAQGTTIIVVEQSLNVALTIAERAVFMEKGEILFDGPTEALLARPDLVRSVFMGRALGGRSGGARDKSIDREVVLRVEDVSVSFGGIRALGDVSLDLAAGEVLGIIGPNGAGKTTLFDVVSGYLRPDTGGVFLDDHDVTKIGPDGRARLGIGRSFQSATLFPALTVRETISVAYERMAMKSAVAAALWAPQVRKKEEQLRRRVDGLIDLLGLEAYADKFVRELSTGTRRAVDIACIMAAQPKVLLLDEPSSGLAQAESEALGPALLRVVRETGCGLIIIEHDMPLITSMSDRMLAMDLGSVIATGTPAEVTSNKQVVESYLSASNDVLERSGSRVGAAVARLRESLDEASEEG